METTKTKIVDIQTGKAQKNVKTLRQQIKELREEMAQLEKGTESYDKAAKQLADLSQKQIEINEAQKYSNKDLGATLSNLTRVSAGVVGAISSINSVMVLMGADSEEAQEAMKKIQAMMAIIQGLSAIDTATKALKGLTVAFKGFNTERSINAGVTAGAATAELAEAGALAENTVKMKHNNDEAKEYNKQQIQNAQTTNLSTEAIIRETEALKAAEFQQKVYTSSLKNWEGYRTRANKALAEGVITEEEYAKRMAHMNANIQRQKDKLEEVTAAYVKLQATKNADTASEKANTAATKGNTLAKEQNAGATGQMVAGEQALGTATKRTEPLLVKMGSSIKNTAKSIVSFVKANPILLAIVAAIGAIVLAVTEYTKAMKKANAEIKLMADLASNINEQYDEQRVRIYTLTSALEDHNSSVEERKKAAEELNKIIPSYNAQLDETTGKYTANKEALDEYLEKLYQKIKLEAYEGKIKEYLQQQLELEEKINKMQNSGWKGWNKFWGRISKAKNDIQDLDMQIDRLFKRINDEIDLSKALDENKNGGGGIKKTFTELFDDLKSLWKEFYKQITQTKEFKGTGNALRDSLMEAINGNLIADKLSDQFRQAMKKGFKDLDPNEITPDFVFDEEYLNGIREKVEKEKETLQNLLKQKKVSQEIIDKQKKKVQETQKELDKVNEVTNAAKAEAKATHEIVKARRELAEATVLYNKQLDIERNYVGRIRREQYREFQYEETNKEIEQQRLLYKNTIQRLEEEKQRRNQLKQQKEQGLDVDKEILQTEKNIAELQKTANEAQIKLDNLRYQKRLTQIQEIYAATEKEYAFMQQQLESERNLKGGGVSDYNTEVDLIELQLQSITARANAVAEYYDILMAQHEQYTEEWYVLEQERNAAMEALQDEYRAKDLEKDRAYVDRKLNIQKTYINLYSAISGQISNILSAEMDMYDSNTEQYKKLKYRQGVISTAEGVLGAFMSGVESGVPAPWNLAVAAAMAATTLTAGIMQLNNIKNEKVGGTMPTTVDLSSREYDTLTYAQGADTLSAIQDQRVWVAESDITSTQNRVEVRESQAAF